MKQIDLLQLFAIDPYSRPGPLRFVSVRPTNRLVVAADERRNLERRQQPVRQLAVVERFLELNVQISQIRTICCDRVARRLRWPLCAIEAISPVRSGTSRG